MTASFFRRGQAGISQSPTVPDFLEHSDGGIDGYTRFAINIFMMPFRATNE
jgi:hypothetical protein